ncbi:MAG: SGNH/GDSL hydrolase family protein [Calditrichaeota bacterium]|nr:SGNH/GDSL hydrolase family protein [Calditrichota bacterium]
MKRLYVIVLLLFVSSIAFAQNKFWLHSSDELLLWGDSITDDGIYPRIVENYVLTYFPEYDMSFFNLGWGGDRSSYYPRLQRDIQLCRPNKVTIMLGMNDGLYKPFDAEALANYLDGMRHLLEILRARSNPEILIISTSPFDLRCRTDIALGKTTDKRGVQRVFYPETLRRFTNALQKLADAEGCRYLDLFESMTELITDLDGFNGNFQVTAAGIHPNIDGQFFMGLQILGAMKAPRDVMSVRINAKTNQVDSTFGCSVDNVKTAGGLFFIRHDQRLPMPVYPSVRSTILKATDFYNQWNRDMLFVTDVDSGLYELHVDGKLIDIVPSDELESGLNLSRYALAPMMEQAYQVFEATEKRHDAFYEKWRRVLLKGVRSPRDFTPFLTDVNTTALNEKEAAAIKEQHRLGKPRAHKFALTPVKFPRYNKIPHSEKCSSFLDNRIKVHIEVDSKTLRSFEPPLCLHGNFTYAPQYQWAILETKGYYTDIPVQMYDDATHGDKKAGDGVFSLDLFLRKNCGTLNFEVQDGTYRQEYWIRIDRSIHRNHELDRLTHAWKVLLGQESIKGNRIQVETDDNATLMWNEARFKQANL